MKRLVEEGQEMYAEEAGENDSENDEAEEFWEEDEDDEYVFLCQLMLCALENETFYQHQLSISSLKYCFL